MGDQGTEGASEEHKSKKKHTKAAWEERYEQYVPSRASRGREGKICTMAGVDIGGRNTNRHTDMWGLRCRDSTCEEMLNVRRKSWVW